MKKIGILLSLILLFINLSAQETENENSKISTSWGYNVHLYKGMFDFQPPVIDTSSLFYPDSYYYYTSFKHVSDLHFNFRYDITKRFSFQTGADIFLTVFYSKPNMKLFSSATTFNYDISRRVTRSYLCIPIALYYRKNNFDIGIGLSSCILSTYNIKSKLSDQQSEMTMDINLLSATNNPYDFLIFIEMNYKSIFKTKRHNFGINLRTSNSTFLTYKIGWNYSIGLKISKI